MARIALITALLSLSLACDGIRETYRCDVRDIDDNCQEYGVFGPDIATLAPTCEAVGGDWARAECPDRDDILAGCEDTQELLPWTVVKWYYAGLDDDLVEPDDVRDECDPDEEQWVPAP